MIYFIQAEGVGNIKIGFTDKDDAMQRMAELQVGSPVKLNLIGTMPGDRLFEMELHRRFKAHHVHGEWFKPCPELMSLVGKLPVKANFEIRCVEVKVMTVNSKQVTQTFFKQIKRRDILDWLSLAVDGVQGGVDEHELGTPWGTVRHGVPEDSDYKFQLVWEYDGELFRCLVESSPSFEWMKRYFSEGFDCYGYFHEEKTSCGQENFRKCQRLLHAAWEKYRQLDHLFIGV